MSAAQWPVSQIFPNFPDFPENACSGHSAADIPLFTKTGLWEGGDYGKVYRRLIDQIPEIRTDCPDFKFQPGRNFSRSLDKLSTPSNSQGRDLQGVTELALFQGACPCAGNLKSAHRHL